MRNYKIVDVAIVGGGPVGRTLSSLLNTQSKHVSTCLIDSNSTNQTLRQLQPFPSVRTWALSPSSIATLSKAGVWDNLEIGRVKHYQGMKVWDWSSDAFVQFTSKDLPGDGSSLGAIVELDNLENALEDKIVGGDIIRSQVVDISLGRDVSDWPVIELDNGEYIRARLVVGADGANSFVKNALNIGTAGLSYNQKAVVATVELEESSCFAWQRFLPSGCIALLPSFGSFGSIVWSAHTNQVNQIQKLNDEEFVHAVNEAFSKNICPPSSNFHQTIFPNKPSTPKIKSVLTERVSFPLRTLHADNNVGHRCSLIGDASHVVHPFAGQGLNLGIQDAADLSQVILSALENGTDCGCPSTLSQFSGASFPRNLNMVSALHMLHTSFSSEAFPVPFIRGVGMNLVNSIPEVKSVFSSIATGIK